MKKKRTQWFGGNVKPMHQGAYERDTKCTAPIYQYWNGLFWGLCAGSPKVAEQIAGVPSAFQDDFAWRGLAEKP